MERVTANVSGVRFEFSGNILENYPDHNLMILYAKICESDIDIELTIDRPADCFAAILAFYQTGELHIPTAVCPSAFRRELEFWNVSASYMPKCCAYRYCSAITNILSQSFLYSYVPVGYDRFVYMALIFLMILLSVFTQALSTMPEFQRALTKCEYLKYLEKIEHTDVVKAREKLGDPDCDGSSLFDQGKSNPLNQGDHEWTQTYWDSKENVNKSINVKLPVIKTRLHVFEILELITVVFFTMEFILRLICCPSLRIFIRSLPNIIDFLALAGFYVYLLVIHIDMQHRHTYGLVKFLNYFQIFRTLRMIRLVSNLRASRVLLFSIRQNIKDMMLLGLLLTVAVSVTGHLIYFMEDPKKIGSIPNAWYWAVITLTTVGYGDISPVTCLGKILASLMSISGVLLLAVTVPTFVNNFLTLYQYACLDDYIGSKQSAEQEHEQNKSN
ncbi:KCNF1-like protein, partial [Mya arenaria]